MTDLKCNCWRKGRDSPYVKSHLYHDYKCNLSTSTDPIERVRTARKAECDRYGIPYSWEGLDECGQ